MNKRERKLAEDKVVRRRNKELGRPELEQIPVPRLIAIKGKGYRIGRRDDRKRFHQTKCGYGHYVGFLSSERHLPRKDLVERADKREADAEMADAVVQTGTCAQCGRGVKLGVDGACSKCGKVLCYGCWEANGHACPCEVAHA